MLDSSYLAERARLYASAIAANNELPPGLLPGVRLKLEASREGKTTPTGGCTSIEELLEAPPLRAAEAALVQHTAAAVSQAVQQIAVRCQAEVLHMQGRVE